jgi:hypothetical protein
VLGRFLTGLPGQQCLDSMLLFLRSFWASLHQQRANNRAEVDYISTTPAEFLKHPSCSVIRLQLALFAQVLERSAERHDVGLNGDMGKEMHELVVLVFLVLGYGEVVIAGEGRMSILKLLTVTDVYCNENHCGDADDNTRSLFLDRWMMQWNPSCVFRHAVNTGFLLKLQERMTISTSSQANQASLENFDLLQLNRALYFSLLSPFSNEQCCDLFLALPDSQRTEEGSFFDLRLPVPLDLGAFPGSVGVWLWKGLFTEHSDDVTLLEVPYSNRKLFQLPCILFDCSSSLPSLSTEMSPPHPSLGGDVRAWGCVTVASSDTSAAKLTQSLERILVSTLSSFSDQCEIGSAKHILSFFRNSMIRNLLKMIWGGCCSAETVSICITILLTSIASLMKHIESDANKCATVLTHYLTHMMVQAADCVAGGIGNVVVERVEPTCMHVIIHHCFRLTTIAVDWISRQLLSGIQVPGKSKHDFDESIASLHHVMKCFTALLLVSKRILPLIEGSATELSERQVMQARGDSCTAFFRLLCACEVVRGDTSDNCPLSRVLMSVEQMSLPVLSELSSPYYAVIAEVWAPSLENVMEIASKVLYRTNFQRRVTDVDAMKSAQGVVSACAMLRHLLFTTSIPDYSLLPGFSLLSEDSLLLQEAAQHCDLTAPPNSTAEYTDRLFSHLEMLAFAGSSVFLDKALESWFPTSLGNCETKDVDSETLVSMLFPSVFQSSSVWTSGACNSGRELLAFRLMLHLGLHLIWDLDWCVKSRMKLQSSRKEVSTSCSTVEAAQQQAMQSARARTLRSTLTAYYLNHIPADEYGGTAGVASKVDNLVARVVGGPPSAVGGVMLGGVLWADENILYSKLEAKYGKKVLVLQGEDENINGPRLAESGSGKDISRLKVADFQLDISDGMDEVLYLESLVLYHLVWDGDLANDRLPWSAENAELFQVPYTTYLGDESLLALALCQSKGSLPDNSIPLRPAFEIRHANSSPGIDGMCDRYISSNDEFWLNTLLSSAAVAHSDSVRWKPLLASYQRTVPATSLDAKSSGNVNDADESFVDAALDMVLHRYGYLNLCSALLCSSDVAEVAAEVKAAMFTLSAMEIGQCMHWPLVACSLLQHQSPVDHRLDNFEWVWSPNFVSMVEAQADCIFTRCVSSAEFQTCLLLTRNIIKNWFFNWLALDDLLTVTALVITANSGCDKQRSRVRVCAAIVAALVLFLVTEAGVEAQLCQACCATNIRNTCKCRVRNTRGVCKDDALQLGGVLEWYQRFCAGRGGMGARIRLHDLLPHLTIVSSDGTSRPK